MRSLSFGWTIARIIVLCALSAVASVDSSPQQSGNIGTGGRNDLNESIFIVDIQYALPTEKLAASTAVGLLNRLHGGPSAVVLNTPNDWKWVEDIRTGNELHQRQWVKASVADLLAYTVSSGAASKVIYYNPVESWSLANVVTLAGLESAIPMPVGLNDKAGDSPTVSNLFAKDGKPHYDPSVITIAEAPPRGSSHGWGTINCTLGLDALGGNLTVSDPFVVLQGLPYLTTTHQWADELDATLWAWAHLFPRCQGTDEVIVIQRPELLQLGFLADLIVMNQRFVFFLPKMCVPGPQQVLFRAMTQHPYTIGKQLKVMGYSIENEVVADCSLHHTEISLVSDWCPNLSFYSMMQPLAANLQQVAEPPSLAYNPNHTYLAVVNSDGDNLQMENNGNRDGMEARVRLCAEKGNVCPPLAWTISNQLATYAPFMLEWYFKQALLTQKDTFLMGPSGYGFLHPSAIASNESVLDEFVANTLEAAQMLSMTSYVHWDIDEAFSSWQAEAALLRDSPPKGPAQAKRSALEAQATRSRKLQTNSATPSLVETSLTQLEPYAGVPAQQLMSLGERKRNQSALELGQAENSFAREAFLQRFDGSAINTVFAPGEYNIPNWIGNVAGIQEQFRWGIEEKDTMKVIERVNKMKRGTIGYIYKIFNVDMKEYEVFAQKIAHHVHLVDHRQLHDIALQKRLLEEGY